ATYFCARDGSTYYA
nr:immunoglobulin heavy chain junction region [Mus musculus]